MKIAVFSDTHGYTDGMLRAIEVEHPDAIIHLGDVVRDLQIVRSRWPKLPVYNVSGNCDMLSQDPDTAYFDLCNVKIMATHGHRYGVKLSPDALLNAAYFSDSKLVLYGHTHIPVTIEELGIRIMNPGTAGLGSRRTYGMLQLEGGMILSAVIKPVPELQK